MGYGTGAIMAVPAHDERDFDFARKFDLPIRQVIAPSYGDHDITQSAYVGTGTAMHSGIADGLPTELAKERIVAALEADGSAYRSTQYKLRDWLFSRQRYWGEPFPLVLDADGNAYDVPESELPLTLPQVADFKPTGTPEPPLTKAVDWVRYQRGPDVYQRETNTMPQWAGSCWYYLRYIDPHNAERFVDPELEKYWMPVDLYVGGVEHAVLHLLYARFWHKVLFDLGHVSTPEPFRRLVNQGLILGEPEAYVFHDAAGAAVSLTDVRDIDEEATADGVLMVGTHRATGGRLVGRRVSEEEVEKRGDGYVLRSDPSIRADVRSYKMSKSRGNVVNPDAIVADYGADALRLYEMYLGPLEAQKPWGTRDIVGMSRFLSSVYRTFVGDDESGKMVAFTTDAIPADLDRQMHRTIKKVGEDIAALRFNTAIAELIKLNNATRPADQLPRELAETFALLLGPFAPHLAEEMWAHLGHHKSLARRPWPGYDEAKLVETTVELPVQVNGKVRDKIVVPADAAEADVLAAAERAEKVAPYLDGKAVRKRLYVKGRLVNFVV